MMFSEQFLNPPREYTLVPFWFLNDELTEAELKRQIDDFEAHGVYGFVPHARIGLPATIPFMSERFLHFTKVCVDYAATKQMVVVLYDEGMYPSGSCAGQVVAANPLHAARCIERRAKGREVGPDEELIAEDANWAYVHCRSMGHIRGVHYGQDDSDKDPGPPPAGDLLNPDAMASFRRLVLDRFYDALREHFGKTVIAVFTDEPNILGRGAKKDVQPWTWKFAEYLRGDLGYDFVPHLAALWDEAYPDAERLRREFREAVSRRLEQTYYAPYSQWCEAHGVALTGHPSAPDDIALEKYFQIPGQDIVWRYIEPYQAKSLEGEQSTMAKCSVSAQRHYGRTRNANECFGAYGWEFTYDEMMYVTNWLFARGVNLLMPHAFYYSVRDKRRDERPPDVGPNNTWWPRYREYADYCRRLSWLLSQGRQVCNFAILGRPTRLPWRAGRVMFESQHDFNYLDFDALRDRTKVAAEGAAIGDMLYRVVIVDGPEYADAGALASLKPMADAGRVVAYGEKIEGVGQFAAGPAELVRILDLLVIPDVVTTPTQAGLRYVHMQNGEDDVYLFVNEGKEPIDADVHVAAGAARAWYDPMTGRAIEEAVSSNHLQLPPLAARVLVV